jgi:putative selenium metabolism protein SsnA
MTAIVIKDALLLDLDAMQVRAGELRVSEGVIDEVGREVARESGDVEVDAGGAVVLPGFVNGHTHLYSALAVGMPAPPKAPRNFHEILQYVWWRLDRALDLPLCELSATIGALDALRCGTTTVIDHHASPNAIDGSLDAIESGLRQVGVRGVLCYETTDRNGVEGRDAGLRENERYLKLCGTAVPAAGCGTGVSPVQHRRDAGATPSVMFAALPGAHAAFTMSDEALAGVADIARRYGSGVHIHVAEDPCDARICREQYGVELLDRLERAGILSLPSILAHGTHLTVADLQRVNASGVNLAHNTRSNMNNAVGYAPLHSVQRPVQLGTDGIGSDMLTEMQTAWFKSRDGRAGLSPADCAAMLANSARRASQSLGITLGKLEAGAAADIVVTDYVPATPLTSENMAGHLIFGLSSRHVRHVMVAGQWRLRDRMIVGLDEAQMRARAAVEASRLWGRTAELPV